jgi:hypothetical protein
MLMRTGAPPLFCRRIGSGAFDPSHYLLARRRICLSCLARELLNAIASERALAILDHDACTNERGAYRDCYSIYEPLNQGQALGDRFAFGARERAQKCENIEGRHQKHGSNENKNYSCPKNPTAQSRIRHDQFPLCLLMQDICHRYINSGN